MAVGECRKMKSDELVEKVAIELFHTKYPSGSYMYWDAQGARVMNEWRTKARSLIVLITEACVEAVDISVLSYPYVIDTVPVAVYDRAKVFEAIRALEKVEK